MHTKEDLLVGASCSEVRAEVVSGSQWKRRRQRRLCLPEHPKAMHGVAFESSLSLFPLGAG